MKIVALLVIFFSWHSSFSQVTIWSENFDSYADGTTTGADNNNPPSTVDWTSGGCTTCPASSADWWEIRSGVMQARDVNNELVFLQSEVIDISGFTNVQFSVDVSETGDHEGPYLGNDICTDETNEDFADVLYRIDGGAWTLIGNHLGWCGLYASCNTHTFYGDDGTSGDCRSTDADWVSSTANQTGLSGSTLEIRLEATNSAGTEFIMFDNMLVQGIAVLPIELLSFNATVENKKIRLDWRTATEINNDFFTIEKSHPPTQEGFNWETVAILSGAGNSETILDYEEYDENPYLGKTFYRLKQTDFDGQFSYSKIVSVVVDGTSQVYPNPASDILFIQMSKDQIGKCQVTLISAVGQQMVVQQKRVNLGIAIATDHLKPGIYLLKIDAPNINSVERIAIRK